MKVLAVIIGLTAALAVVGAAPATTPVPGQVGALKALRVALAAGRIDGATANAGRAEIARAAHLVRTLPSGRREHVAVALEELAAFSGRLTGPRAVALIGQLQANDDYFAKHYAPSPKTDITDADGLVYRYFPGRCLEFHPLANFGALNARVAANDAAGAQRLADALIARGVYQQGGGLAWEYFFDYSGGRAPWLSGMAQAVAAQAFARTAALVPDQETALMRAARGAYRAIPNHLLTSVAAGPWIRLYSFQSLRVLNAQLQAVISLQSYATTAEDPAAAALAARMQRAAAAMLPSFDTGYWTYYSLPHEVSPLDYQQFVVQLLKKLAPSDPRFADAATRFAAYQHQPPAFRLTNASLGALRFWLSKPATVQVNTAAGPTKRLALGGGWHTLAWPEPKRPGVYPVHVTAVDWAANRASFDALPIVRATAAGSASAVRTKAASTEAAAGTFAVGAALDDPAQGATLQKLGLQLARIGVTWPPGVTEPDPSVVAALQRLPAGLGSVVELTAAPLPLDDAGRAALAEYAAALAQQTPGLRSLVLAPAASTATAGDYALAFDQIRTAVQTVAAGRAGGCPDRRSARTEGDADGTGASQPGPRRLPSRSRCGQRAVDDRGAPTVDRGSDSSERHRAADPARWTATRERGIDLVARLQRASRRCPARPAEPGDPSGRRGCSRRAARRTRLPGRRSAGRAHRPRVSGARHPPGLGAIRLQRRLPLSRHARWSRRAPRRRAPRCAPRRGRSGDDRAAGREAGRGAVPRRGAARRLRQPGPADRAREPAPRLGQRAQGC